MSRSLLHVGFSRLVRASLTFAILCGLFLLVDGMVSPYASPASHEPAGSGSKNPSLTDHFVPGEVLVRFSEAALAVKDVSHIRAVRTKRTIDIPVRIEALNADAVVPGLRRAVVRPEDTLEAIEALRAMPEVLYAEPNYLLHSDAIPNDPRYPEMYALNNSGQTGGVAGAHIGAELAWNISTGSHDVVVGIIDTGIDINHEDLHANVWTNTAEIANNGFDDDQNGLVDDINGWDFFNNDNTVFDSAAIDTHGTHVAGTIGAVGNNSLGTVGVNWRVKLLPLKFLGSSSGSGPTSAAIAAINYAQQLKSRGINLRVLNASWGGRSKSQALYDAINSLHSTGILFVTSAGNEHLDTRLAPHYPCNFGLPNLIAVGATDSSDGYAFFSNWNDRVLKTVAPGSAILSTTPGNSYQSFSGTSMATAHVTGAAALLLAASPGLSLTTLTGALVYSGDLNPSLELKTTTNRRLNVFKSLETIQENDTVPPAGVKNLHLESQGGINIGVYWEAPGDDGLIGTAADYDIIYEDGATGVKTLLPTRLSPASPGTLQGVDLRVPFRTLSGTIEVRTYDNAGNYSSVSASTSFAAYYGDPYEVSMGPAMPLSSGGVRLPLNGDDEYLAISLPIQFQSLGGFTSPLISTNGALFFTEVPRDGVGLQFDLPSSRDFLAGQAMIAGLWDDLVIDNNVRPEDGVFEVRPSPDTVIYRWQGVTFDPPNTPISFEIELKSDNSIVLRYGSGNTNLFPVVGIGLGEPEPYLIESHSAERGSGLARKDLGNAQTITFTRRPPPPASVFDLSSSSYFVNEASESLTVTVVRGATTPNGFPILGEFTVNYETSDGTATRGNDYVATSGMLTFSEGESVKAFVIPLIDDSLLDANEVFNITLSNPTNGAALGSRSTGTVLIVDNEDTNSNAIDDHRTFVRQQYLDFLNREPDQGGWDYWTAQITECGTNLVCAHHRRIGVSGAFFVELEFQRTGYVVYRMHRAAFGTWPNTTTRANLTAAQFMADRSLLPEGAGLVQSTTNLANSFVQRPEFLLIYSSLLTNAEFVNLLFDKAELTPYTTDRQQHIEAMNNNGKTRAQVLLDLIEIPEFKTREYNRSFVLMQYFGYLRRDPDQEGYDFWLNVLENREPNNYRGMICSFITSAEYQQRFGTAITRTNRDCSL